MSAEHDSVSKNESVAGSGQPDGDAAQTLGGQLTNIPDYAAADKAAQLPQVGMRLGNFELQAPIGRGGMGEVWKALDTVADRLVVIKFVPPELRRFEEELDRVKTSFQQIHALQHQHICPTYLLEDSPALGMYLVMKFIDGTTLSAYRRKYVSSHGAFPLSEVIRVLRPVAAALDYAHSKRIVHRDIKPQNIMVSHDGSDVQVVDFGLVAEFRTSLTRVSQQRMDSSGTYPYMAPEQWRGHLQNAATDQYALGVVAYELLADRLPFQAMDDGVLRQCVLEEPIEQLEEQPDTVNQALARAMAKQRDDRFADCTAFIEALELAGKPNAVDAQANTVQRTSDLPGKTPKRSADQSAPQPATVQPAVRIDSNPLDSQEDKSLATSTGHSQVETHADNRAAQELLGNNRLQVTVPLLAGEADQAVRVLSVSMQAGSDVKRHARLLTLRLQDGSEWDLVSPLTGRIEQVHVKPGRTYRGWDYAVTVAVTARAIGASRRETISSPATGLWAPALERGNLFSAGRLAGGVFFAGQRHDQQSEVRATMQGIVLDEYFEADEDVADGDVLFEVLVPEKPIPELKRRSGSSAQNVPAAAESSEEFSVLGCLVSLGIAIAMIYGGWEWWQEKSHQKPDNQPAQQQPHSPPPSPAANRNSVPSGQSDQNERQKTEADSHNSNLDPKIQSLGQ